MMEASMQVLIREVRGSFLDEPCPKVRLTWDICGFIEPPVLNCLMVLVLGG
jgi:hypothetical protein